jgi:hypothetical protein
MADRFIARAEKRLETLRREVDSGQLRPAAKEWGGANVIVSVASQGGRYREVLTPHALIVSAARI